MREGMKRGCSPLGMQKHLTPRARNWTRDAYGRRPAPAFAAKVVQANALIEARVGP
jgi:hypothetical protein